MKNVFKIFLAATLLTGGFGLFNSCDLSYDAHVCGIEILGGNFGDEDVLEFTEEPSFVVSSTSNGNECATVKPHFGVTSVYALKKSADWKNNIIWASFQLKLDTVIRVGGEVIAANTDLFLNNTFKTGVGIEKGSFFTTQNFEFRLSKKLMNQMEIDTVRNYILTVECYTDDNQHLFANQVVRFSNRP